VKSKLINPLSEDALLVRIIEIGAIINVDIQDPMKGLIELSSAAFFENKPI
jgi:hypothetical protein